MTDEDYKKEQLDYLKSIHKELRDLKNYIHKLLEKMS